MSSTKIEAGTAQHLGGRQQQNDRTALYASARAPGYVLAVLADGIAGGAIASEQVLHTSKHLFDEFRPGDAPSLERLSELLRSIAHESHAIIKMSPTVGNTEAQCSLALLLLTPAGQAVWAHVGDTRLYRFFNGQCESRTNDLAYIDHLVQEDGLPLDAAKKHRSSKLLANTLGNRLKEPFVSVGSHVPLNAGDAFLLCSDGLWSYFADAELAAAVARNAPRQAAELLINKATERAAGKGDNCSMAIVKLVRPPREVPNYVVQKMGRAV
jgi:serine/threonine protein phosphatase PrpC